ncbi:MAG TPA: glycosyltransferase [Bacteroidota bacterium]|nr:glycosyltransferase [Bacteroidota bacterium]
MAPFLKNKDIVIVVVEDWNGPWRHYHKIADELVREGNRVLFVEAYYSLFKFIRKPDFARLFRCFKGARKERDGLWLLAPPARIPGDEFSPAISRWNWFVARFFIRRGMRTIGFERPILWLYSHHAGSLVGTLDESLSLYFCGDHFPGFFHRASISRRVAELERSTIRKVDVVVTVSDTLSHDKAPYAKECHTVDHGSEFHLYTAAANDLKRGPVPFLRDIVDLPRPIIGFQGVLRRMIDVELVASIAERRPHWTLVFVGPFAESSAQYLRELQNLSRYPNVRFLGPKSPGQVPYYVFQFDVCMIPYVRDVYVSPLKFYEYVSAGKPVVTTIPVYSEDERVVLTIRPDSDPVAVIEKALTHTAPEDVERRIAIGRSNSWENRVAQLSGILENVMNKKRASAQANRVEA